MTRTVADTDTLVSAFLWGGAPREVLHAARRETITLFTSAALIAELEEVLAREKFANRIVDVGSSVDDMIGDYLALAQLVRPSARPPAVVRDPDDDTSSPVHSPPRPRSSSPAIPICSRSAATRASPS